MRRLIVPLLLLTGCGGEPAPERERVVLVTTTTVEASGLLDRLVGAYHAAQDRYQLSTAAVASGAALELGRRGDADVLLTHDPVGEARFVEEGYGTAQGPVMENEFILVGPPEDPARVRGLTDLAAALDRIAAVDATFISRGDQSGTQRKERELWTAARRAPWEGAGWYIESGDGMAETLRLADQRGAYTLTDVGTFRHLRSEFVIERLASGDPPVANRYRLTLPRDPRHPEGARDFIAWLTGPGQEVIGAYGTPEFGEPLFRPVATPGQPGTAARPADSGGATDTGGG